MGKRQELEDGRFLVYPNNRRREGKRDSHYVGTIKIDGQEYWLNMWENYGKEGSKMAGKLYFSGSIGKPKDEQKDKDAPY